MENKFVSIVVYLNNCESRIESFLQNIMPTITENFTQHELICVDDGCYDGTLDKLHTYLEENKSGGIVSVIHMGFHQGIEAAMNAGRDLAIGDFVYEFDNLYVDYESNLLFQLYETLLAGYDIVSASSNVSKGFTSKLFYKTFNKYSNSKTQIGTETFRILSRRAINRIKSMGVYIPYRKAVYANCGLNTKVVKYTSTYSKEQQLELKNSYKEFGERGSLALDSFIYFTNMMEKWSAVISGIFLLISIVTVVYVISDYLIEGSLTAGWTSLMGFMSIGFFGVFALLTIIMKYLSVMLDLIFKKQKYLVADIEKIVVK